MPEKPFFQCVTFAFLLFGPWINPVLYGKSDLDSLFFAKMDSLSGINQRSQALQMLKDSQARFEENQRWESYINCLNYIARYLEDDPDPAERWRVIDQMIRKGTQYLGKGHFLLGEGYQQKAELFILQNQLDSAISYLDKASDIFERNQKWENLGWALIVKAVSYYRTGDFLTAESNLLEVLELVEGYPMISVDVPNTTFNILAAIYVQIGSYDKSLEAALRAIEMSHSIPDFNYADSLDLIARYNNLGIIYAERQDHEQAIQNYRIALNLSQKTNAGPAQLMKHNHEIGRSLQYMGQFEAAEEYFLQSRALIQSSPTDFSYKDSIKTQVLLAINRLELDRPQESLRILRSMLPIAQKQQYFEHTLYYYLGMAYAAIDDYAKAIFYYQKAYASSPTSQSENYQKDYTKTLQRLGEVYLAADSLDRSLHFLQEALRDLKADYHPSSLFLNPTLENFSAYALLLPILSAKAQVLNKKYTENPDSLEKVLLTYQLASQTIDRLRQDHVTEEAKLLLSQEARSIYDGAIDLLFRLYEASGEYRFIEQAFDYMERGKSLVLLENIREYKAIQSKLQPQFVSDSLFQGLIKKEHQLKRDRVFYERKLAEVKASGDSLKMQTLDDILVKVYTHQQKLQSQLSEAYPAYHQTQGIPDLATILQIQSQLLGSNQSSALLEYYLGDGVIYVIQISRDQVAFYRQSNPEGFDSLIQAYRKALADHAGFHSAKAQYEAYVQSAHTLYQLLIADILVELPTNVNHLFIIPDGKLGYISFESLLATAPDSEEINYSIHHLDYLLEHWQISYSYSSTLLLENDSQNTNNTRLKPYLGFAPVYDHNPFAEERMCENGQMLGALPNTATSISQVQDLLGGDIFLRTEASKDNFLRQASNYRILHLSTHACADDHDPLFNRIFFANDYLSAYEIYNLSLGANMVVLSACETGFGELAKGEGIISLARSFMYAGSQSVVTSLWNAHDYTTTQLMVRFHAYLSEGLSRAEALHKAKIDYLDQATFRASAPFYWANFILIGNAKAIPLDAFPLQSLLIIFSIILLGGLIIFLWFKQKM